MTKRYKEDFSLYSSEYLVSCPKCDKIAIVSKDSEYGFGILRCSNCMHTDESIKYVRYKAFVKRNCPYCGKGIYAEQSNLKEKPIEISVSCSTCNQTIEYKPNIELYSIRSGAGGLKCDPYFNLTLWLQSEVRGNLFWAYNREHLEKIKIFVSADLREREFPYLMTMVARLPHFIKDAKNRDEVLKVIGRLEQK